MVLSRINMKTVTQVQINETGRQLVQFINTTLKTPIFMLPSEPEYVSSFMPVVLEEAQKNHHGGGKALSYYVLSNALLGLGWMEDPRFSALSWDIKHSALDASKVLDYALNKVIEARKHLDQAFSCLHLILENRLTQQTLDDNRDIVEYWKEVCAVLQIDEHQQKILLNTYTQDHFTLPENLPHKELEEFELNTAQRTMWLIHLHSALCFGRYYRCNPLHQLVQTASQNSQQQPQAYMTFIRMHQSRLNTGKDA